MNDAKALWLAIRKHPGEGTPKLVLADWYEENGRPEMGLAIRWCVARGKWPRAHVFLSGGKYPRLYTRHGWVSPRYYMNGRANRDVVPVAIFTSLPHNRRQDLICARVFYYSAELAVRDLAAALFAVRTACEVPA